MKRERIEHINLKKWALNKYKKLGYNLISFDKEITRYKSNGIVLTYKPDLILENDEEVLFIEAVITSDHNSNKVISKYRGKPVRFIKYYSLDHWPKMPSRKRWVIMKKNKVKIPRLFLEALGLEYGIENKILLGGYPSLQNCQKLFIKKG